MMLIRLLTMLPFAFYIGWTTAASAEDKNAARKAALSIDVSSCNGEPNTPACAAWVLSLCEWKTDAKLCEKIGLTDIVFIKGEIPLVDGKPVVPAHQMGRVLSEFPTLYKIERTAPKEGRISDRGYISINFEHGDDGEENRILAVQEVPPERFEAGRDNLISGTKLEDLIGTHEVMVGPHFLISLFFRRENKRWKFTSWAQDGGECVNIDPYMMVNAMCRLLVSISTWEFGSFDERYLENGQWPENADDYIRYFRRKFAN